MATGETENRSLNAAFYDLGESTVKGACRIRRRDLAEISACYEIIEQFAAALIFFGKTFTFWLFVPCMYERGEQVANLPTSEFIEFFAPALMFSPGTSTKRDLAGYSYERV